MNKFIQAIKSLKPDAVIEITQKEPKWIAWSEEGGKNGLHYLCGLAIGSDPTKSQLSLKILKLLLKSGMDVDAVHKIPEAGGFFPATPLWYAYTRGRNKKLFAFLLENGADPENCMFAIAWNDDVLSAKLFKKFGARVDQPSAGATPFLAAFQWKRFKVAQWFLENGADVNFADDRGNTALFYAVKRRYETEPIRLLLRHGADYYKTNHDGISPKQLAESNRQRKIMNLFGN